MKVAVWDTYVKRQDGKIMHFDILVKSELKDENSIYRYGNAYLSSKPFDTNNLTSKECKLCHIETAPDAVVNSINDKGFHIIEMENCD